MSTVIRVRTVQGKLYPIPDGAFVEICDEGNLVACVIYKTLQGEVNVIMPDDIKEQEYYSNLFDVKFCNKVVDVESVITDASKK